MSATLLSSHWYRVAPLRPRLRPHLRLFRHRYRGERWFVLRDPVSGRSHRYTPGARLILCGMDGRFSVDELWAAAQRELGEGAPTQDEMIALLGQLHAADLIQCEVTPDAAELFERAQQHSLGGARDEPVQCHSQGGDARDMHLSARTHREVDQGACHLLGRLHRRQGARLLALHVRAILEVRRVDGVREDAADVHVGVFGDLGP